MNKGNRGKYFFANQMHRELFFLIFFAALIPTLITAVGLFYLIFSITAEQIGFPEAIADNVIPAAQKVMGIMAVVIPIVILIILKITHKLTHQMVGPFDRIIREIDEHLKGARQSPIVLRKNDKFSPLVERVNILLSQLPKQGNSRTL